MRPRNKTELSSVANMIGWEKVKGSLGKDVWHLRDNSVFIADLSMCQPHGESEKLRAEYCVEACGPEVQNGETVDYEYAQSAEEACTIASDYMKKVMAEERFERLVGELISSG